ncbi:1061_t:CDS:1, partial [Scutellospora calospora]
KEPDIEIICHLEWNNHYRVFGHWKCQCPSPQHYWRSAYTWISLRKFIEGGPIKDQNDFYIQKCTKCLEECNKCKKRNQKCEICKKNDVINDERCDGCKDKHRKCMICKKCDYYRTIIEYTLLEQSESNVPHKRDLCSKCRSGAICRNDNRHYIRQNRNIKLFSEEREIISEKESNESSEEQNEELEIGICNSCGQKLKICPKCGRVRCS